MEIEGVLFVPHTPGGKLMKLLQSKEDQLCSLMGLRKKVQFVERSGTKIIDILSESDPWKGAACGRDHCLVCTEMEWMIKTQDWKPQRRNRLVHVTLRE